MAMTHLRPYFWLSTPCNPAQCNACMIHTLVQQSEKFGKGLHMIYSHFIHI